MLELIDGPNSLIWIQVLVGIVLGGAFCYFGYHVVETLKFLVGFVLGGSVIGGALYAGGSAGAGILGFIIGGLACGILFVWLVNLIPIIIGALALGLPTFIYLAATQPSGSDGFVLGVTALAAVFGGGLGHWLRILITIFGTAAYGALLLGSVPAEFHLAYGGLSIQLLRGDRAELAWVAVVYGILFLSLFASGVIVQFRNLGRPARAAAIPWGKGAESGEAAGVPASRALDWQGLRRRLRAPKPEGDVAHAKAEAAPLLRPGPVVTPRQMSCVLRGETGNGRAVSARISGMVLAEEGAVVGRSVRRAAVVIDDDTVSRQHLRLFAENSVLYIEDLDSKNGTRVNGSALESGRRRAVRDGDRVQMGAVRITLGPDS